MTANRDFILSIDEDLVYKVTQLWDAYHSRNSEQWLYFINALSESELGSEDLDAAKKKWKTIVDDQPDKWLKMLDSYRGDALVPRS